MILWIGIIILLYYIVNTDQFTVVAGQGGGSFDIVYSSGFSPTQGLGPSKGSQDRSKTNN